MRALNKQKIEEWRDIPSWEGLYQVSNLGNVRSLDRVVRQGNRWGGLSERVQQGVVLQRSLDTHGYAHVCLSEFGRRERRLVGHLVMAAFGPPRPTPKHTVDHRNVVRTDDRIDNLRWLDRSDQLRNQRVRNRHGLVGVCPNPRSPTRPYMALARPRGEDRRKIYLGSYATPEEAHIAYVAFRDSQMENT